MAVATFDTLKFANALKAVGASVLAEALQVNFKELATKDDLKALEERLKGSIDLLKWMVGFLLFFSATSFVRMFFHA